MLNENSLKTWLHRPLSQSDKILLVLGTFENPADIKSIKARASKAGLRMGSNWNPSTVLSRTKGLAIRTDDGWELADSGKQHLRNLGVGGLSPAALQVATSLRHQLEKIKRPETRSFVEEAVRCHEAELYRSAVVMAWSGAISTLYDYVTLNALAAFNAEAKRVDSSWKDAKNCDDLGRMKEGNFLDRVAAISLIGKNVKEQLKKQLDLRNACGHPNTFQIGPNTVTSHIEILILNVFSKFS